MRFCHLIAAIRSNSYVLVGPFLFKTLTLTMGFARTSTSPRPFLKPPWKKHSRGIKCCCSHRWLKGRGTGLGCLKCSKERGKTAMKWMQRFKNCPYISGCLKFVCPHAPPLNICGRSLTIFFLTNLTNHDARAIKHTHTHTHTHIPCPCIKL